MTASPFVAVVTPVYNGEQFLDETMRCVQALTYPNLVHVILDNCSSDGTAEIIARYTAGRVPLLVHRNSETVPLRDNWNSAVSHVPEDAEYIRLLCADDTMSPESVSEMVALAETDPEIGVVGCDYRCFGEEQETYWPEDRSVFDGIEAIRMTLLREGIIIPIHTLVRKSVADRRQPLFQPPLQSAFDLNTALSLLTHSKFGFVHKSLGFIRVDDSTVTNQQFGPKTRAWTREALYLMNEYGPKAFGSDYEKRLLQYRRYYVRRILKWRREDGGDQNLGRHFEALKNAGWPFNWVLVADALMDWGMQRLGVRRNWSGYPGWQ